VAICLSDNFFAKRGMCDASPPQMEYSLSTRGRAFDPVYDAMVKVAAKLDGVSVRKLLPDAPQATMSASDDSRNPIPR